MTVHPETPKTLDGLKLPDIKRPTTRRGAIAFFLLSGATLVVAIEESPFGLQILRRLASVSAGPTAGEVGAGTTATPLGQSAVDTITSTATPTAPPPPVPSSTPPPTAVPPNTQTAAPTLTTIPTRPRGPDTPTPVPNLLGTGPYVQDAARFGLISTNTAPLAEIFNSGASNGDIFDKNINSVEVLSVNRVGNQQIGHFVFFDANGNELFYFDAVVNNKYTGANGVFVGGNVPNSGRVSLDSLSPGALISISITHDDLTAILSHSNKIITIGGATIWAPKNLKGIKPLPTNPISETP